MKKVLLITIILLLTGCNYNELSSIGIISLMQVGYSDNQYSVTLEVLSVEKEAEEQSYFITGSGNTINEAISNIKKSFNLKPYFAHMYALILNHEASTHINELIDYLDRDTTIRKDFYLFIGEDIENIKINNSSIGKYLYNTAKNNNSTYYTPTFREIIRNKINDEGYIIGEINCNKFIEFTNEYYISKDVVKLSENSPIIIHLISNNLNNLTLNVGMNDYLLYDISTKRYFNNNTLNINLKSDVRLINIPEDENIIDSKIIGKLEHDINEYLNKLIYKELEKSINDNLDYYGLKNIYFKYTNNESFNLSNVKFNINIKVNINEKGLLFDNIGEQNEE